MPRIRRKKPTPPPWLAGEDRPKADVFDWLEGARAHFTDAELAPLRKIVVDRLVLERATALRHVETLDRRLEVLLDDQVEVVDSVQAHVLEPPAADLARRIAAANEDPSATALVKTIVHNYPGASGAEVVQLARSKTAWRDGGLIHATLYRLCRNGHIEKRGTPRKYRYFWPGALSTKVPFQKTNGASDRQAPAAEEEKW